MVWRAVSTFSRQNGPPSAFTTRISKVQDPTSWDQRASVPKQACVQICKALSFNKIPMHAYIYLCTYVHKRICIYIYIYVYVYVDMYT